MTVQALIFDFDGLLVDTETLHYETWNSLYESYGVRLRLERWLLDLGTHGMFDPVGELEELLGRPIDRDATLSDRRAHHIGLVEQEELRPGVREILAAGREAGLKMAVASSSSRDWVERWLGHHAIREYFTCVCSRDDVRQVKPAPDLFLCAAACLDIAPGECIVFEDSPNGMRAAAAAGIRCVAVPNSLTADLELPPVALRVDSLAELPLQELIERVEAAALPAAG
jgi:HAD superfamily hydrolase (TIGR01509 family)